jgi:hypothetical protein
LPNTARARNQRRWFGACGGKDESASLRLCHKQSDQFAVLSGNHQSDSQAQTPKSKVRRCGGIVISIVSEMDVQETATDSQEIDTDIREIATYKRAIATDIFAIATNIRAIETCKPAIATDS